MIRRTDWFGLTLSIAIIVLAFGGLINGAVGLWRWSSGCWNMAALCYAINAWHCRTRPRGKYPATNFMTGRDRPKTP